MTKLRGATSLVALALLGCLVWTEAEAQDWRRSGQSISNFASLHPRSGNSRQTPRDPTVTIPQKPYQSNSQGTQLHYEAKTPEQTAFHSCEVTGDQRIPCGAPDISAERCDAISCCFDGRQCYFPKAVTVQCTKDGHFIVVVARDATLPKIDLESISLLHPDQGCGCVDSNSAFAIYHFPVTGCGTVVTEEPGFLTYENRMSSSYEVGVGLFGVITRDSKYELLLQCRYSGTSVEALVVELGFQDPPDSIAAEGPVRVQLKLANGRCTEKGCNEVEAAYTSFYTTADYPVTKVLREPVYVEVELMEKTDPMTILTLDHCWATASSYPHSLPQWDILINGCPSRNDPYLSQLVPIPYPSNLEMPDHHKRFMFKMFSFVDTNGMEHTNQQVYIHCSTSVCLAIPGRICVPPCSRMKREVQDAVSGTSRPKGVISVGPVILGKGKE